MDTAKQNQQLEKAVEQTVEIKRMKTLAFSR
jgi:hypothetical protein